MKKIKFHASTILQYLKVNKIAVLDDLKRVTGTTVSMTVFRKLKELRYLSSCSHRGICQWKLDTFKNNLDSNHRVFSVFGLLIQAATGALGGLGEIPLKRSG